MSMGIVYVVSLLYGSILWPPHLQISLQVFANLGYFIFTNAQQGLQSMCKATWCPSQRFRRDDLSQDRGANEMRTWDEF